MTQTIVLIFSARFPCFSSPVCEANHKKCIIIAVASMLSFSRSTMAPMNPAGKDAKHILQWLDAGHIAVRQSVSHRYMITFRLMACMTDARPTRRGKHTAVVLV